MKSARMLDGDHQPSEREILAAVGAGELWLDLRKYIDQSYDFAPELVFYGKKHGWTIRYRRSGKTLISLFPEHGAFTALVVLGKKEGEKIAGVLDQLSSDTRDLIGSAKQLHDGKWLWIRVLDPAHVEDVKRLLAAKRKPIAKSTRETPGECQASSHKEHEKVRPVLGLDSQALRQTGSKGRGSHEDG